MTQPSFHQTPNLPRPEQSQPTAPPVQPTPTLGGDQRPPRKKLRLILILISAFVGSFIVYALVGPEHGSVGAGPTEGHSTLAPPFTIAPGEVQRLSALDLHAGDCYNQEELPPPDGSTVPISTVELVSCESAHNSQVIAQVAFKITDNYQDIRDNKAAPACDQEYQAKLRPAILADTTYQSVILSPADQASWTHRPSVACVLFSETPRPGSALVA